VVPAGTPVVAAVGNAPLGGAGTVVVVGTVVVGASVVVGAKVVVGARVVVGAKVVVGARVVVVAGAQLKVTPLDVRCDWVRVVAQSTDCTSPGARCSMVVAPIAHDADKKTAPIATRDTQNVRRVMMPPLA